jgi:hypothetical protein
MTSESCRSALRPSPEHILYRAAISIDAPPRAMTRCGRSFQAGRDGMSSGVMLAVLRIVSGLLFLEHGLQKFVSFPPGPMAGMGLQFNSMPAYAGVIELICGLLIAIGRLLVLPRAGQFLPGQQWRRRRDPLLLHLPLSGFRGRRSPERGRGAGRQEPAAALIQIRRCVSCCNAALDFRAISCYIASLEADACASASR